MNGEVKCGLHIHGIVSSLQKEGARTRIKLEDTQLCETLCDRTHMRYVETENSWRHRVEGRLLGVGEAEGE